jgi:hypothetical protein
MNSRNAVVAAAIFAALTGHMTSSLAHHGPPNEPLYNTTEPVVFDGEVTEVFWRNPHARFRIRVTDGPNEGEIWEIETNPVGILLRTGFTTDLLPIGSSVKVAGAVSRSRPRSMALYNLLLPNGYEFADAARPRPLRFSEQRLSTELLAVDEAKVQAATRDARGIFRVWSRSLNRQSRLDLDNLTPAAQAARAAFNRADDPILDCVADGMPRGMLHPPPISFSDEGDRIILRAAEHDLVRTIHMTADVDPRDQPATPLGYSVGRWEDVNTLVVTTSRVDWPYSDANGTPQSDVSVHLERFSLSDDDTKLVYELTSIDPPYLIGPSVRRAEFTWDPSREIEPYNCALWDE